jgi:DNA uptake protein ComE-like DNA-binding protein
MIKTLLIATNLIFAVLLTAAISIAATEKSAGGTSPGGGAVASVKAPEATSAKDVATPAGKVPAVELLDINSASAVQLQKVLGIGEETAKKIIAGRPYVKKDQLKSRKIITAAHYYKIKDSIIAHRPANPAKTARK